MILPAGQASVLSGSGMAEAIEGLETRSELLLDLVVAEPGNELAMGAYRGNVSLEEFLLKAASDMMARNNSAQQSVIRNFQ